MSNGITRRELLGLALVSPLAAAWPSVARARVAEFKGLDRRAVINAPGRVVGEGDDAGASKVKLVREWRGPVCRSRVVNRGRAGVRLKEVVLFDIAHRLTPETKLYGEGFQMLSQTGGTLGQPFSLSQYTDAAHYKLPAPPDARVFYGMMTLAPPQDNQHLLAFTSCRRFVGQFYSRASRLQVVVDTEGLELKPGEMWELEEFTFESGHERAPLLARLAERLNANHAPLRTSSPPTGWCSWYCFGPRVTARQVLDNLDFIAKNVPGLKYIQIDDGYQPAMGDWLETGAAYRRGMQAILRGTGDGFVLGCNHPVWPSLGLIHGSRSSNDIKRSWDRFASTARQNLSRNWQNGRLW